VVALTPTPTNMDAAPIPTTDPNPMSFRQKRPPPELPAPELIFANIVPLCAGCAPLDRQMHPKRTGL
jgi:hypothetical protein